LAFVKVLLARGCSVIIGDLGLNATAEKLLEQYKPQAKPDGNEPILLFHKTDVTSFEQLDALWEKALDSFPHVDLVVPGAGIYEPPWSSFWHAPGADGSPSTDSIHQEMGNYATFSVNLIHPIRLSQLAIGYWSTTKTQGCLLFIGSMGAYVQTLGTPYYYSSKAGLHGFIKSLAGLRKRLGIRVVGIAPGATRVSSPRPSHGVNTRVAGGTLFRLTTYTIDSALGPRSRQDQARY
jgi:NAD(P)-dependent dehydrogenase (short-subunit alcohol dehydrogenase family)